MTTKSQAPKAALKEYFGFDQFKGTQEEVITSILEGKDTFVIMPTGGGKSLCYQLPALMGAGLTIVVSPLIALMKNQVDQIRSYTNDDSVAHYLNSSLTKKQTDLVKDDISTGKTKIVYVAPETLSKSKNIEFLAEANVEFVAVDEAHCISEWGHDFRPDYRKIKKMVAGLGTNIPTMALTATATPKVQADIRKNLGMKDPNVFVSSFNRDNLYYEIRPKVDNDTANKSILKFIQERKGKSGIIYVLNRKTTQELAATLKVNGINAAPYHAGLDSKTRSKTQDDFLQERVDVIVATIAFGMGIDKPDVRFVIHYNTPKSIENYYQETGRAGRDGMEGECIAFYSLADIQKLEKFLKDKGVAEKEIGGQLISEMVGYCETPVCRRKYLLKYFGEDYQSENCNGLCDNCKNPKQEHEAKDYALQAIEAVSKLKENFKINYVSDFLRGVENKELEGFGHHKIEGYGAWNDKSKTFANSVLRQCIIHNLLEKDIEKYGLLYLTKEGKKFQKKPWSVLMMLNRNFKEEESSLKAESEKPAAVIDKNLLALLKDLRKKVAQKKDVPPFVVFQDPSLSGMAAQFPTNLEELTKIQGVSQGKAKRYGKEFVGLIEKYVSENNIERPNEDVFKSIVNKSGMKVFFIQSIDRKLPFAEIAKSKGLSMEDAIKEVEAIVNSGTKLDINYHISEVMDELQLEDIYDYFRTADSDSIEDAVEEFEDDGYSQEEIQLVRIKFMSEMAN